MIRYNDRWLVSARELLNANPGLYPELVAALRVWAGCSTVTTSTGSSTTCEPGGDTKVTIYPPGRPDQGDQFQIFGNRPLPNGRMSVGASSLNIPSTAERPLNWSIIAPVAAGIVLVGAGLWWRA